MPGDSWFIKKTYPAAGGPGGVRVMRWDRLDFFEDDEEDVA